MVFAHNVATKRSVVRELSVAATDTVWGAPLFLKQHNLSTRKGRRRCKDFWIVAVSDSMPPWNIIELENLRYNRVTQKDSTDDLSALTHGCALYPSADNTF